MIESHRSLEEMSPSDYDVLPKMHVSSDMQTFDRNTFLTERALCHHITSRGPGTFEANLQLPVIIGEVPESERELFSNLPIPELESPAPWMVGSTKEFSFLEIADLLPGTTELIKNDLGLLGVSFDSVVGRNISFNVDRMPVEFQAAARSWHIDGVDAGFKPVFDMFYLICDNNPTIAFEGPASLDVRASPVKGKVTLHSSDERLNEWGGRIDFNGRGKVAVAPEYGIMRMNAMTMHAKPWVDTSRGGIPANRTVMRVWLTPDREPFAAPTEYL